MIIKIKGGYKVISDKGIQLGTYYTPEEVKKRMSKFAEAKK